MSSARFSRTGRCRFYICIGVLIIMVLFVAIFHNSQLQLDESRQQRLRCEQQQGNLNEQLEAIVEQKFNLEREQERKRYEQLEARREIEQKLTKEQIQNELRYDKIQQTFKILQLKYDKLETECVKSKKLYLSDNNAFEQRLQQLDFDMQKDKIILETELAVWKEKYKNLTIENQRLLKTMDNMARETYLREIIAEYAQNCEYKPRAQTKQQINKSAMTSNAKRQLPNLFKPHYNGNKSFIAEIQVSPGLYQIGINLTNRNQVINITNNSLIQTVATLTKTTNYGDKEINTAVTLGDNIRNLLPYAAVHSNQSMILNSLENFQMVPKELNHKPNKKQLKQEQAEAVAVVAAPLNIAAELVDKDKTATPLNAPRKIIPSSTQKTNIEVEQYNLKQASLATASNGTPERSRSLPALGVPPKSKLPEMVAPIPENFEEVIQLTANKIHAAKLDTPAMNKPKNDLGYNINSHNRNFANDMGVIYQQHQQTKIRNTNSGALEVNNHDFLHEQNFNLHDNHFISDAGAAAGIGIESADKKIGDMGNESNDDDDNHFNNGDAVDVGVRQSQHLLDADNLNNEIAGDQGKEFPDGIRIDENIEEDQDEDDYSNPAARKQGAEAIRN